MSPLRDSDDDLLDDDEPADLEDRLDAALDDGDREEERIDFLVARKRRVDRLYDRCRACLSLARRYRFETGVSLADDRVRDCVAQVALCREAIARLRMMQFGETTVLVRAVNDND